MSARPATCRAAAPLLAAAALLLGIADAGAQPRPAAKPATECPECPLLALVSPGRFQMGTASDAYEVDRSTGETPPVAITVTRPFYLSRTEVTVGEFRRFVAATGHVTGDSCVIWRRGAWALERGFGWENPGLTVAVADDQPVSCVNWDDAQAYVAWLAQVSGKPYRLPSEAEWEYGARGGTSQARFFGTPRTSHEGVSLSAACDYANTYDVAAVPVYGFAWPNAHCTDRAQDVAPVGRYQANAFGLHDMIGNVREWVADCYTASYKGRPQDARAWVWGGGCEQRGVRGGSWASRPLHSRSAAREAAQPGLRRNDLGFRVARDYDAPAQ